MRPIDADALSNKLGEWWNIPKDWDGGMAQACEDAFTAIDDAPTIDAQPVAHSEWKYYHKKGIAVCKNCSFERDLNTDFGRAVSCPNCGAKMDQEVDHD